MFRCLLVASLVLVACGETTENNSSSTNNTTTSNSEQNNANCEPICPAGEIQEFGTCEEDSCVTRMVCGEEIVCRGQAACLATASCTDGGLPLDACPPNSQGCLPQMICGATKYCLTLQQCARDACDAGEAATTLACADPAITLPCRETTACGADAVSCVCRAADLFCEEEETFSTTECQPGEMCREVVGCGTTFYCKGGSI
jgi:hypothetical protein